MSTRRSRLQVKPNIGGLKGPAKSVRKAADSVKDKVEIKEKAGDNATEIPENKGVQPKEHAKDKLELQDRKDKESTSKIVNPKDIDNSSKLDDSKSDGTKSLEVEATNLNVDSAKNDKIKERERDGVTDKANDASEKVEKSSTVLPRARLRRFGKVNLSAARGPVGESVTKTDVKDKTQGGEKADDSSTKATNENQIKTIDPKTIKVIGGEHSKQKESKVETPIPRRARFPKAKPNVLEAGKRRQKTEDPSVGKPSVPSVIVTPAPDQSSSNTETGSSVGQPSTADQLSQPTPIAGTTASSGVQPDEVIQPAIQAASAAVDIGGTKLPHFPRSPLKAPVAPSILASPLKQGAADHKRGRTVSVSEPAVPKKPKRAKIEMPCDQPPDRTTMRMRDLIYWTPSNNPMKAKVSDPTKTDGGEKENVGDKPKAEAPIEDRADEGDDLPVPQVTIGPDGNIIVNEKSLVLDNPNKDMGLLSEIVDETDKYTTYTSFKKRCYSKKWTDKETTKFYKALAMLGTDFFMMSKVFPNRNRVDLKKKFKMEDKRNRSLIERVMRERIAFDEAIFNAEESPDEEKEKPKPKERKVTQKKPKKEKPDKEKEKAEKSIKKPDPDKPVKRRKRKKFNYYEDSWSEDEPEVVPNPVNPDSPWQPPCVSQKDGEVVGILMDMSEGRLPTASHAPQPSQSVIIQFDASQSGSCSRTSQSQASRSSVDRSQSNTPDIQMLSDDYFNVLSPEMLIARPLEGVRVDTGIDDTSMRYVEKVTATVNLETATMKSKSASGLDPVVMSVNESTESQIPEPHPMKLPLQIVLNPTEESRSSASQPLSSREISTVETGSIPNVTHSVANIIGNPSIPISNSQLNAGASIGPSAVVFNTNPLTASAIQSHTVTQASSNNQYLPVITSGLTVTNTAQNPVEESPYSMNSLLAPSSVSSSVNSSVQRSSDGIHSVPLNPSVSNNENNSNKAAETPMQVLQSQTSISQLPSPNPPQSTISEPVLIEGIEQVTSQAQGASLVPGQSQDAPLVPGQSQGASLVPGQSQGALFPGQAQIVDVPSGTGEMDQYVLVSMGPETGEETVIHVYRFHGRNGEV